VFDYVQTFATRKVSIPVFSHGTVRPRLKIRVAPERTIGSFSAPARSPVMNTPGVIYALSLHAGIRRLARKPGRHLGWFDWNEDALSIEAVRVLKGI
jgi:hypothetical protein